MEAERNLAIERENKILLGKMYSIMNAEPAYKTHKVTVTSLTWRCASSTTGSRATRRSCSVLQQGTASTAPRSTRTGR